MSNKRVMLLIEHRVHLYSYGECFWQEQEQSQEQIFGKYIFISSNFFLRTTLLRGPAAVCLANVLGKKVKSEVWEHKG